MFVACSDGSADYDGPAKVGECRFGGVIDASDGTSEEAISGLGLMCGGEACSFNDTSAYHPCSDTEQLIRIEFITASDGGDRASITVELQDGEVGGAAYAYYYSEHRDSRALFNAESGSIEISRIATNPSEPNRPCVEGRLDIRFHETLQMTGTFSSLACRSIDDLGAPAP